VQDADGLVEELSRPCKFDKKAASRLLAHHCHKKIAAQTCEAIGA
jgi:hypothetical protein